MRKKLLRTPRTCILDYKIHDRHRMESTNVRMLRVGRCIIRAHGINVQTVGRAYIKLFTHTYPFLSRSLIRHRMKFANLYTGKFYPDVPDIPYHTHDSRDYLLSSACTTLLTAIFLSVYSELSADSTDTYGLHFFILTNCSGRIFSHDNYNISSPTQVTSAIGYSYVSAILSSAAVLTALDSALSHTAVTHVCNIQITIFLNPVPHCEISLYIILVF